MLGRFRALDREREHRVRPVVLFGRYRSSGTATNVESLKLIEGETTMKSVGPWHFTVLMLVLILLSPGILLADVSKQTKDTLDKLLLGKEVKPLVELPATKEGVDIYLTPPHGKRVDGRGLDLGAMSKELKSKGVGVEAQQWETITDVKVDSDRVEIHLGGGGEGRRGANHANKVSANYLRAGGSRVNFRYMTNLSDRDLQPEAILNFMSRVLDVSKLQSEVSAKDFPLEIRNAIAAKTVTEGMTYQMVQVGFGDPEQKKINDTTDGTFSETWFYLKDGHRWVLTFVNGKVSKVQVY